MQWGDDNSRMLTWQTQRERSDMDSRHLSLLLSVSASLWAFISAAIFICLIRIGHFSGSLTAFDGDHHKSFDAESAIFTVVCPLWPKTVPSMSAPTNRKRRLIHTCCSPSPKEDTLLPELYVPPSSRFHYHLFHQECIQSAPVCQGRFKSDYNWVILGMTLRKAAGAWCQ